MMARKCPQQEIPSILIGAAQGNSASKDVDQRVFRFVATQEAVVHVMNVYQLPCHPMSFYSCASRRLALAIELAQLPNAKSDLFSLQGSDPALL